MAQVCPASFTNQHLRLPSESSVKVFLRGSTGSFTQKQAFTEPFIKDQEQSSIQKGDINLIKAQSPMARKSEKEMNAVNTELHSPLATLYTLFHLVPTATLTQR